MSEVYLGNPNLKKANTPIEFTKENIQEFLKCKDDPVYFANNYIKIVSLDEGLVPFRQYPFQKKINSKLSMRTVSIYARCLGRLVNRQRLYHISTLCNI